VAQADTASRAAAAWCLDPRAGRYCRGTWRPVPSAGVNDAKATDATRLPATVAEALSNRAGRLPRVEQFSVDFILAAGAIWTVSCNLAYLAGWSLRTASMLSAAGLAVASALFLVFIRHDRSRAEAVAICCGPEDVRTSPDRGNIAVVAAAVIGLILWMAFLRTYLWFWLISVPLLTWGCWRTVRARVPATDGPAGSEPPARPVLLALLCAAAVLVTLATRQPSQDDCYYLNRSATLADDFTGTMRTGYSVLEKPGLPWPYPSYPLTAFHDFVGLLSWATGLEPLAVSAYILAPVGAVLMVFAYSLLCRTLFGRRWPWALVGVFILLAVGGSNVWHFANFGFPRIWQGKSLVLHVILPLVAVLGLRYGANGRLGDLLRLAGAATCAAGLSSISIWLVPSFTVLAALGGIQQWRHAIPRLVAVVAACGYPLAEGLLARSGFTADVGYRVVDRSFEELMQMSFGGSLGTAAWAAVVLLAPLTAPGLRTRRYLTVSVLGGLLTLMNPALFGLVVKYVTSAVVFWRVTWALPPMAVLAACLSLAGFQVPGRKLRKIAGPAVWCLLTAAFVDLAIRPPYGILANPGRIGWPGLKVTQPEYDAIALLMAKLPPGSPVMAPEEVGWMIPTFRHRLGSIAPRLNVIDQTVEHQMADAEEAQMRRESLRISQGGLGPGDEQILRQLVERYGLRGVVMAAASPGTTAADSTLERMGFKALRQGPYILWIRP
jgi:hypothetical protein